MISLRAGRVSRLTEEDFCGCPSVLSTPVERCDWEVKLSCPLSYSLASAFKLDKNISASVITLLFLRGPSTISYFIIAIDVTAFKSMSITRRVSHISIERLKALNPSTAYGDTASSIPLILFSIWIQAALFHTMPDSIDARVAHAMSPDSSLLAL